jgi:hypothetical protein
MKSTKGQIAAVMVLMLGLFLQMEGRLPDIFASSDGPVVLIDEIDGVEFKAVLDKTVINDGHEVLLKTTVTNKGKTALPYYADTRDFGMRGVIGAAFSSQDSSSSFTDKLELTRSGQRSAVKVLQGTLAPGQDVLCDFNFLPYYKDQGSLKLVEPGAYILKLWYTKQSDEVIRAEFPVSIVKRFGKLYIKS